MTKEQGMLNPNSLAGLRKQVKDQHEKVMGLLEKMVKKLDELELRVGKLEKPTDG